MIYFTGREPFDDLTSLRWEALGNRDSHFGPEEILNLQHGVGGDPGFL